MPVEIVVEEDQWNRVSPADLSHLAFQAVVEFVGLSTDRWEAAVLFCGDSRISDLNAEFRSKSTPTNVLSWPSESLNADKDGDLPDLPTAEDEFLGDVAISYEICLREAQDHGKSLEAHATHLLVHGFLHLLGFDHERDGDAALMEKTETQILGKLGIPDPYST